MSRAGRRDRRGRRDREWLAGARLLGWRNLGMVPLIVGLFVGAVLLIGQGLDLSRAHIRGSATIVDCEAVKGGWHCDGRFTSFDGSTRIDTVRIYPMFLEREEPSGTVNARVSGPDATQADASNDATPMPLVVGAVLGLIGLWWVYMFYVQPARASGRR